MGSENICIEPFTLITDSLRESWENESGEKIKNRKQRRKDEMAIRPWKNAGFGKPDLDRNARGIKINKSVNTSDKKKNKKSKVDTRS